MRFSEAKSQYLKVGKLQCYPIQDILNKYPGITKIDFRAKIVKHGAVHHIDTGNATPCQAKMLPLMAGSPKKIQGKKEWDGLDTQGVVERVDSQESNLWTSALHLVGKPDGTMRA